MKLSRYLAQASGVVLLAAISTQASLLDNGDGTVTQIRSDGTRLMWLQDANHAATSGYPAYQTITEYCHTPNPASCFPIAQQIGMTHADSLTWAGTLNVAGHTDWRMASALNPDGSGPWMGAVSQGATGEMLNLASTEGVWRDAPGPFTNVQLSYWTGSSGFDIDDGIWSFLTGANSQSILQSKQVVVGPDLWVFRRFAAWAVRDMTPLMPGDVNADGFVGISDLNTVLSAWNQNVTAGDWLAGDPSGDGFIGIEDLNVILGNWNAGTPPTAIPIPAPASAFILICGVCLALVMSRPSGGRAQLIRVS